MFVGVYDTYRTTFVFANVSWFIQLINNVVAYLMLAKYGCIPFQTEFFERSKQKMKLHSWPMKWAIF